MLRSLYYVNLDSRNVYRTTGDPNTVVRVGRFEREDDRFRFVETDPEPVDALVVEGLLFRYVGTDSLADYRDNVLNREVEAS